MRPVNVIRRIALAAWLLVAAGGLYLYIFHGAEVQAQLQSALSTSALIAYAVYLVLGALRGFTLIPSTTLVLAAIAFFPPWPLLALTLIGILLSSAGIYLFAESLGLDEILERKHAVTVAKLRAALARRELPIIIAWSFFPLAPTDLIVYVCGVLKVDFRKCLLGVLIGEGSICALYIFGADTILRLLR